MTSPEPPKGVWAFRSRPDLSPAAAQVTTTQSQEDTAPGYVFVALKEGAGEPGPMIIDDQGQLVWFGKYRSARDFKMQYYQGRAVLTWWEGKVLAEHGVGEYVIFDGSYREIARVRAGNGYRGDLHEFLITPEDTALLVAYAPRRTDLSPIGGLKDGLAWEGIVQEVASRPERCSLSGTAWSTSASRSPTSSCPMIPTISTTTSTSTP